MKKLIISCLVAGFVITSCQKEEQSPSRSSDIVVAGNDGSNPASWENRFQTVFSNTGIITCSFTKDTTNYFGGSTIAIAPAVAAPMYSRNKKLTVLTGQGTVYALAVQDTSVYAAGNLFDGTNYTLTVWKDGVRGTDLGTGSNGAATSISVSGTDVYVGGYVNSNAYYWKNNVAVKMPSSTDTVTYSNAIFVSGNDVYLAGSDGGKPVYWKNGNLHRLNLSVGGTAGFVTSITVYNSSVFVGGYQTINAIPAPTYWVDGEPTVIANSGQVNSILVRDDIIYTAGFVFNGTNTVASYWINSEPFILPHSKNNSNLFSIIVK